MSSLGNPHFSRAGEQSGASHALLALSVAHVAGTKRSVYKLLQDRHAAFTVRLAGERKSGRSMKHPAHVCATVVGFVLRIVASANCPSTAVAALMLRMSDKTAFFPKSGWSQVGFSNLQKW